MQGRTLETEESGSSKDESGGKRWMLNKKGETSLAATRGTQKDAENPSKISSTFYMMVIINWNKIFP